MFVEISFIMVVLFFCCERGFFCMLRFKIEYRNFFDVFIVDYLMNICLNGFSLEEFVVEKVIIYWV